MSKQTQGPDVGAYPVKNVFSELSPASINFSLALSGQPEPDLEKPFTYAELGSGFSLSTASWAAQYPSGQFFAINNDSARIQWTRNLAERAKLSNLTLMERSFKQVLDDGLPPLDYLVLHNTYGRVSEKARGEIRAIITKFLKPGGVVYVGYNALPGFAVAAPLHHLVCEGVKATGEKNPVTALAQGLNFLKELEDSGALYFKASSNASAWLESWRHGDVDYLLGEFFGGENRAYAFTDMQAEMGQTKTTFIGSLDVANYLEPVLTPPEFMKRLEQVNASLPLRETVKDILYNTLYRRDLFMKGPQALVPEKAKKALEKIRLVLSGTRIDLPEHVVLKGVQVSLKADIYNPVMDFLAEGSATIAEIAEKIGQDFAQVAQASVVMIILGWVQPSPPKMSVQQAARVKAFNVALDDMLAGEPFSFLLSVNGAWQHCGFLERLYGLALLKDADPLTFIQDTIDSGGFQVNQDGEPIEDKARAKTVVAQQVSVLTDILPPVLKRLGLA